MISYVRSFGHLISLTDSVVFYVFDITNQFSQTGESFQKKSMFEDFRPNVLSLYCVNANTNLVGVEFPLLDKFKDLMSTRD